MNLQMYLFCVLGVIISLVLPIIRAQIPKPESRYLELLGGNKGVLKHCFMVGIFSLITALLLVAVVEPLQTWKAALLAGYAWDSTLQKLAI